MCAELQARLEDCETKAAALEKSEAASTSTASTAAPTVNRVEVEKQAVACRAELEAAQSAREFGRCIELQSKVDAAEAALAAIPTVASLQAKIAQVNSSTIHTT